jgi:hypothetical protein
MSKEEGDFYRAIKKERQEKRWSNNEKSLKILEEKGIKYETLNSSIGHYRIGNFDFWPNTGMFYNRKLKKAGRGVFNLINFLKN